MMVRQRSAWARNRRASSISGECSGSARSSSRATTAMVPKGVPSSCAAAVASAPSAASRCSRDKASCVAARPADMRADSDAMRQA